MNSIRRRCFCRVTWRAKTQQYSRSLSFEFRKMSSDEITEQLVGISAYANKAKGFTGIHKQRFSDFVVREIDVNDNVIYLSSTNGSELEKAIFPSHKNNIIDENTLSAFDEKLKELFTSTTNNDTTASDSNSPNHSSYLTDDYYTFLQLASSKAEECPEQYIAFPCTNKQLRTQIHQLIKSQLYGILDSDTIIVNQIQQIRLIAKHKIKRGGNRGGSGGRGGGRQDNRNNSRNCNENSTNTTSEHTDNAPNDNNHISTDNITTTTTDSNTNKDSVNNSSSNNNSTPIYHGRKDSGWLSTVPNYLQFTLLKENIDTLSATLALSKTLRCSIDSIKYSGTKDKRGITTQLCTIYHRRPSEFNRINNSTYYPILRLGDYKYVTIPLSLGQLHGNQFEIVLRDIHESTSVITAACTAVKESGFINYFGLQRFGKGGLPTYIVGKAILMDKWKDAIDAMFALKESDKDEIREPKLLYQKQAYLQAYEKIPYKLNNERMILSHLIIHPSDYHGAIQKIPKNSRLLFVHAYQSYIFNLLCTKRMELYGLQLQVGDLVYLDPSKCHEVNLDSDELVLNEDETDIEVAEINTETLVKESNESMNVSHDEKDENHLVHIITQDDINSKKYTIDDVILPLLGSTSILPQHEVGTYTQILLAQEKITLSVFNNCLSQFRTHGSYRKFLIHPKDFEYSILTYSDPNEDLNTTELNAFRSNNSRNNNGKGNNNTVDQSDLRTIIETNTTLSTSDSTNQRSETIISKTKNDVSSNKYTGALLKFKLPSGTYATMFLREITKESTETIHQMNLTAKTMNSTLNNTTISNTITTTNMNTNTNDISNSDHIINTDDTTPLTKKMKTE